MAFLGQYPYKENPDIVEATGDDQRGLKVQQEGGWSATRMALNLHNCE